MCQSNDVQPSSAIAFAGDQTIVGLGVDNLLFAIDPTTADIRWRRPLETASITCPDSARIAADGEFFTVYGRTFAQPFHARTGVPLGARATPGGFAAVAAGTRTGRGTAGWRPRCHPSH